MKRIVINVVEGSSGGYMEVVKGQSSKHTLNETKDRGRWGFFNVKHSNFDHLHDQV